MGAILKVENLVKYYEKKAALDSVSFEIPAGKIVGLLGPNGSGKTTLIKIVNSLITDYSGNVLVDGHEIGIESKKAVSYLPDADFLGSWMRIRTAIGMYADFYENFDKAKALEMIKVLGLNPNDKIKTLSKGMNEKFKLALVMARKAKLYIFDEPIAAVDPAARDFIMETILKNYNEEGSILLSTHLISDIEQILDRVLFLKAGKLILDDEPENIREANKKSIDQLFREVFKC